MDTVTINVINCLLYIALFICLIGLIYSVYKITLPNQLLRKYLLFDAKYYNGELFDTSIYDIYYCVTGDTYVCVSDDYVIFGITENHLYYDGHSVMYVYKRCPYEINKYRFLYGRDYQSVYGVDGLDFLFYVVAYRHHRFGEEIVSYNQIHYLL